MTANLTSKLV